MARHAFGPVFFGVGRLTLVAVFIYSTKIHEHLDFYFVVVDSVNFIHSLNFCSTTMCCSQFSRLSGSKYRSNSRAHFVKSGKLQAIKTHSLCTPEAGYRPINDSRNTNNVDWRVYKMSSVFARRTTALCAKPCVRYFRQDYNSVNFDFLLVSQFQSSQRNFF